jgi:hypothetical protein
MRQQWCGDGKRRAESALSKPLSDALPTTIASSVLERSLRFGWLLVVAAVAMTRPAGANGLQNMVKNYALEDRLPPNPRLQRTPSASPPSPLSRQPLGAGK